MMDNQTIVDLVVSCGEATNIGFPAVYQSVGLFTTLGSIFLTLVSTVNQEGSPVATELHNLNRAMNTVAQEMRQDFKEVLIKDNDFLKKIINKIESQERYFEFMLTTRSNESVGRFELECYHDQPRSLFLGIIDYVQNKDNRPITPNWNSYLLKSRETFDKWRRLIEALTGMLARLHGVYSGLTGNEDDGTFAEDIRKLETLLNDSYPRRRQKRSESNYWPAVTRIVETTMTRTDLRNDWKADLIKNALGKIDTLDEFYIVVFNEGEAVFYAYNEQTLFRLNKGGCNVVVYASKTSYKTSYNDYDWLKEKVESWQDGWIPGTGSLEGKVDEVWDHINWQGFVGLIRQKYNPAIRSTGRDWQRGPGWWITAHGSPSEPGDTVLLVGLR